MGDDKERSYNVRIIAATKQPLNELVKQNLFRNDLWERLNRFIVRIPSLRDRPNDLHTLVGHFLFQSAREYDRPEPTFTQGALECIRRYTWPGNVRQLANVVAVAVMQYAGTEIDEFTLGRILARMEHAGAESTTMAHPMAPNVDASNSALALKIREAMQRPENLLKNGRTNWYNVARYLKMDRHTLRRKRGEFGIE